MSANVSDCLILNKKDSSFDLFLFPKILDLFITHTLFFTLWFLVLLSALPGVSQGEQCILAAPRCHVTSIRAFAHFGPQEEKSEAMNFPVVLGRNLTGSCALQVVVKREVDCSQNFLREKK